MQPSKQGFLYLFDRKTGAPVWPIEERPVPRSTVPGEKTSPTQAFPLHQGKQYIVVDIGTGARAELVALTLPSCDHRIRAVSTGRRRPQQVLRAREIDVPRARVSSGAQLPRGNSSRSTS